MRLEEDGPAVVLLDQRKADLPQELAVFQFRFERALAVPQSLLGPLHVTTAVTDIGKPTESKSIAAGFKFNW